VAEGLGTSLSAAAGPRVHDVVAPAADGAFAIVMRSYNALSLGAAARCANHDAVASHRESTGRAGDS
jgi:hypothetical protein